MFGFGSFSHLVLVLVLALILLGPKQLPEVARTLGRLLQDLRRMSNMLTDEFRQQMYEDERQRNIQPPTAGMPTAPQNQNASDVVPNPTNPESVPYQPHPPRTMPLNNTYMHPEEANTETQSTPATSTEHSAASAGAPSSVDETTVAPAETQTEEKKS